MKGIIYKQLRYKSVSDKNTPLLNVKHLQYIATKEKECEFNEGCSFSLWGSLEGSKKGTIKDWQLAKKTVGDISRKNHIVYRAIISLDKETATEKGYCNREPWQKLSERKISDLAKQYNIKPENFCWLASYHYKEDHPHTHFMFWDKSNDIHNEYIPSVKFEDMTEKIRASFNKDIFAPEIRQYHNQQNKVEKELVVDIKSLLSHMKSSDPNVLAELKELLGEENFVTDNISSTLLNNDYLKELGKELIFLAKHLPKVGSLKYAFLDKSVKAQVDLVIDTFLKNPVFAEKYNLLSVSASQISKLYGNTDKRIVENTKKIGRASCRERVCLYV